MCLIPGDGIGPEISRAVQTIFEAASVPIEWEIVDVKPVKLADGRMGICPETINTIRKNKIGLKGNPENNSCLNSTRSFGNTGRKGARLVKLDLEKASQFVCESKTL